MVADVWEKDVWEFQGRSGSSGSCRLFLHFLGKIAVQKMSGKTPGSPRHPSSRHPRPSEKFNFLPGVVFAKECEFLLVSLGECLGSGSGGWWGVVFPWKIRGKGKGVGGGGGVGTGKGSGKSTRKLCRNYPLAIYALVSPRIG